MFGVVIGIALAAAAAPAASAEAPAGTAAPVAGQALTVVSWGGSYGRASKAAVMDPFTAETGVAIRVEDYNGGLAQIRAQVETGNVYWDVVDLDVADLVRGCDEGVLEPIPAASLPAAPNGVAAIEDYLPGTLTDCGASQLFYAMVFAYRADRYGAEAPTTIADFFDLEKFPGRRGLRRKPSANLEMALMADGVPPEEVYATLDTEQGMARAFRKLDAIKSEVIWWEAGAQPPQLLADAEVAMTTAYNGRIFNAQVVERQPFVVVWDGQVYDSGGFGIVAGTPALAAARRFVAYAARPASMARISQYIAYGPVRRSALPLVDKHAATGTPMAPHMPTSPANQARALLSDWNWWANNGDDVSERFSAWLAR